MSKRKNEQSGKPGPLENLGRQLDELPAFQAAESAVRRAREELEQTIAYYEQVAAASKEDCQESMAACETWNVGDCIASTLRYVSRHPLQGVLAAGIIGVAVGKVLGKWK